MTRLSVVAIALLAPAALGADEGPAGGDDSTQALSRVVDNAPIRVTINPEALLSASVVGPLPRPGACGESVELVIGIVNQGFVTAPLGAEVVGDAPVGVTVELPVRALRGSGQEVRTLRITQLTPGPADLTIAFFLDRKNRSDTNRIHLLLRCT